MNFKIDEIKEHAKENLLDCCNYDADFITQDESEIHNELFNTDYYIIGRYEATQWLKNETFNIIGFIKDYEMDNFGEIYTDLSEAEKVVNMYVYIIGEQVLTETIKEVKDILRNK